MALRFDLPVFTHRLENPAQQFARTGEFILGETVPLYNGNAIDSGVQAELPKCDSQKIGGKIQITKIYATIHRFGYEVSLPPDSEWLSDETDWKTIKIRIENFVQQKPTARFNYTDLRRIRLDPIPLRDVLLDDTQNHEMQHVIDFRWAAETIFSPWSNWVDQTSILNNPFSIREATSINFVLGGGYGGMVHTIMNCYLEATRELGKIFHNKPRGHPPIVEFSHIDGNMAVLNVSIKEKCPKLIYGSPSPQAKLKISDITDYSGKPTLGHLPNGQDVMMKSISLTQNNIDEMENQDLSDSDNAVNMNSLFN